MSLPNTHYGYEKIKEFFTGGPKKIFFSGIGGISMNSLARLSLARGHEVSGYDRTRTHITASLEDAGIKVFYTSSAESVRDVDVFVYTVAIPPDDPAYVYAGERGIPRISRADFLGYIMMGYESRIGVSGMHGKSTTTAMLASVYEAAGDDPTVFGGAEMKECGSSNILGGDRAFIFEACEYMDSFLDFYPTTAVVLNIEMDHVDYFRSMEQIKNSFAAYMSKASRAVVNISDDDAMAASRMADADTVAFGGEGSGADYTAERIVYSDGCAEFDICFRGELLCHPVMHVPGHHIVVDATAAAAAAHADGVSPEAICDGLSSFCGIARRMELRGQTDGGADVYDDYAHHPTELRATLRTASEIGYGKLVCVFQPHTYSRTASLFDDFAAALASGGANEIVLAPIYPARETDDLGVSSELLAERVASLGMSCRALGSFAEIADYVRKNVGKGDAVLVVGAGDVNRVSELLTECD